MLLQNRHQVQWRQSFSKYMQSLELYHCSFGTFYLNNELYVFLPANSGLTVQTVIGPCEANCPNDNSKKNRGIPAMTSMTAYGMRKVPVTEVTTFTCRTN